MGKREGEKERFKWMPRKTKRKKRSGINKNVERDRRG